MSRRLELQEILEETLGSANVYFQPPTNVTLQYPCIVYSREVGDTKFADDKPYAHQVQYQVMVIGKDPDSAILDKVAGLPQCRHVRYYPANNLHHDVYSLFY